MTLVERVRSRVSRIQMLRYPMVLNVVQCRRWMGKAEGGDVVPLADTAPGICLARSFLVHHHLRNTNLPVFARAPEAAHPTDHTPCARSRRHRSSTTIFTAQVPDHAVLSRSTYLSLPHIAWTSKIDLLLPHSPELRGNAAMSQSSMLSTLVANRAFTVTGINASVRSRVTRMHRVSTTGLFAPSRLYRTNTRPSTVKSFPTQQEAEHFVRYGTAQRAPGKTPQKYYAVQQGRKSGVYTDWDSASAQIVGWTKPKYKAFATRAEAEDFVKNDTSANGTPEVAGNTGSPAPNGVKSKKPKKKGEEADNMHVEDEDHEAGEGPLPPDTEDGFDPRVMLNPTTGKMEYKSEAQLGKTRWQANGPADEGMLRIYTDGSSLGNGANGAVAGVGVYFGPNDKR